MVREVEHAVKGKQEAHAWLTGITAASNLQKFT